MPVPKPNPRSVPSPPHYLHLYPASPHSTLQVALGHLSQAQLDTVFKVLSHTEGAQMSRATARTMFEDALEELRALESIYDTDADPKFDDDVAAASSFRLQGPPADSDKPNASQQVAVLHIGIPSGYPAKPLLVTVDCPSALDKAVITTCASVLLSLQPRVVDDDDANEGDDADPLAGTLVELVKEQLEFSFARPDFSSTTAGGVSRAKEAWSGMGRTRELALPGLMLSRSKNWFSIERESTAGTRRFSMAELHTEARLQLFR